jgi:hypothetical protein
VTLDAQTLVDLGALEETLTITGGTEDSLSLSNGFAATGDTRVGESGSESLYATAGGASLWIDDDIAVSVMAA